VTGKSPIAALGSFSDPSNWKRLWMSMIKLKDPKRPTRLF
jgi:hypothetical protein